VVVDTNLFVSGSIIKHGIPYQLLMAWRSGSFLLLISEEQRTELEDVLHRPEIAQKYRLSQQEIADLLLLVDNTAPQVPLRRRLPVKVRDPKDAHLLAAALGGKADYLVTGDEDLLVLNGHPKLGTLAIVNAREFLDRAGS